MKMLLNMFELIPIVYIGGTLLIIIGLSINNNKLRNILFTVGVSIVSLFTVILMGIVVPYAFLSSIFKNITGFIVMLIIIVTVWLFVSLFIELKNKMMFFKNDGKDIYIRDVDVKYSPAVLSYLMNNKIETRKDLPATLLNLCAKNILKIEKDDEGKINIIDLKNEEETQKLSEDEKYAYEMLVTGVTSSKIISWKNKVEEEYAKYRFSKEHQKPLGVYILYLYIAIFVVIFICCMITGEFTITGKMAEIVFGIIVGTFFGAWEMIILSAVKSAINSFIKRDDNSAFKDTYTRKGALEFNRWKKFERFIQDFTLIKDRKYESIVILGNYLAYSIALGINKKCDSELYKAINKEYSFDINILADMFNKMGKMGKGDN